jgi:hypothetical protein
MALAIFRSEHKELSDMLTSLGAEWNQLNQHWSIDEKHPNVGEVRRLVEGNPTREESEGYAELRRKADHDRKMIEHDLTRLLVIDVIHDHTHVRYVVTITGDSGREYPEFERRDESGAFDTFGEADRIARDLVERLTKGGKKAILAY